MFRRSFLGTLAAVALLGRATVKAADAPKFTPGFHDVPFNQLTMPPDRREVMLFRIDELEYSMKMLGQMCSIKVDKDGIILDGLHRFIAAQQIGWKTIRIHVI